MAGLTRPRRGCAALTRNFLSISTSLTSVSRVKAIPTDVSNATTFDDNFVLRVIVAEELKYAGDLNILSTF
jgi:hypothetical protein